jgi:hypothetical protein
LVSTEGFLQFGPNFGSGENSATELALLPRIAGLWDNLRTNNTGDNIYLDTSVANQVKFRWDATNEANNGDVNFSITLFSDGRVRYDYGTGNTGLTPTVGVSLGNGRTIELVAGYDNATTLANANSVEFNLATGIRDIGAYEYRGDSNDLTPPTISITTPAVVFNQGLTAESIAQIQLALSEQVNLIDTGASIYELRSAGVNNTFDNGDDVVYQLTRQYNSQTATITLGVQNAGQPLPAGRYRLTVVSNANT